MSAPNTVIFAHPNQDALAKRISEAQSIPILPLTYRHFPDGETYIRLLSDVRGKNVILVASLDHPDDKIMWVYFVAQTALAEGACTVHLLCPYLGYMRQDQQFHPGESVTSRHFAALLSTTLSSLVTVDPHLHRYKELSEIYTIPTTVLHAAPLVAKWVSEHVKNPLFIGPDSESAQWAEAIATQLSAPFVVLEKTRRGDHDVSVSVPDVGRYQEHTPILIDDIISTARTMIDTLTHLKQTPLASAICIGIHGIFSGSAYQDLQQLGCSNIVTTTSITHPTNQIDISPLFSSLP